MKQLIKHLLGLAVLFLALAPAAYAQYSPPPPYFGTNPSVSQIKASIIHWGQVYHVPPHILFGIAWQEGNPYPYNQGWLQYDPNDSGRTVYHLEKDGRVGVGIMQITVLPSASDYKQLCIDYDYNIQRGAEMLGDEANPASKWRVTPIIGDNDPAKLENWYYAIWAYNGFSAGSTYPGKILNIIANCPNGQWQSVLIKPPTAAQIASMTTIPNTPSPYHVDANFDGIIDGDPGSGFDPTNPYVDGSATGAEVGTATSPFHTIAAAVNAASATQAVTLHIKPYWYKETLTIHKNIHMVTNGTGTVRIGG